MNENRMILSALVVNHAGVLLRVAGLFSRRGFNIDSLTVCETENPEYSRMTIAVHGDKATVKQITSQLLKLEDVVKILILPHDQAVCLELLLLKLSADASKQAEIVKLSNEQGARVRDISENSITLEYTGQTSELDSLIEKMQGFGILEMARTGITALGLGGSILGND